MFSQSPGRYCLARDKHVFPHNRLVFIPRWENATLVSQPPGFYFFCLKESWFPSTAWCLLYGGEKTVSPQPPGCYFYATKKTCFPPNTWRLLLGGRERKRVSRNRLVFIFRCVGKRSPLNHMASICGRKENAFLSTA